MQEEVTVYVSELPSSEDLDVYPCSDSLYLEFTDLHSRLRRATNASVPLLEQENEVLRRAATYLSQASLPSKGCIRS